MGLNPVLYSYKEETGKDPRTRLGFIAEEVGLFIPEAVTYLDGEIYGVEYPLLTSVNTKAIQDTALTLDELLSTGTSTMGTTSPFYHLFDGEEDTVWEKLVRLANDFVDGVLRVAGIETKIVYTKKIETDELCVGSVCVTEAEFRAVFGGTQPASAGSAISDGGNSTSGGGSNEPVTTDPVDTTATSTNDSTDADTGTDTNIGTTTDSSTTEGTDTSTGTEEPASPQEPPTEEPAPVAESGDSATGAGEPTPESEPEPEPTPEPPTEEPSPIPEPS